MAIAKHYVLKKIALAMVLTSGALTTSVQACDLFSGGFVAAAVECLAPPLGPTAREIDRWNGQLGRPFDHAAARAADSFVPGAGAALEGGWAIQDQLQRMPRMDSRQPRAMHGGGVMWGNFCATPFGVAGPGPANPVGAVCYVPTPNGVHVGQVVR